MSHHLPKTNAATEKEHGPFTFRLKYVVCRLRRNISPSRMASKSANKAESPVQNPLPYVLSSLLRRLPRQLPRNKGPAGCGTNPAASIVMPDLARFRRVFRRGKYIWEPQAGAW